MRYHPVGTLRVLFHLAFNQRNRSGSSRKRKSGVHQDAVCAAQQHVDVSRVMPSLARDLLPGPLGFLARLKLSRDMEISKASENRARLPEDPAS